MKFGSYEKVLSSIIPKNLTLLNGLGVWFKETLPCLITKGKIVRLDLSELTLILC